MSFDTDVKPYIKINEYFKENGQDESIDTALREIYAGSPTLQTMFKNMSQHVDLPFRIDYMKNAIAIQVKPDENGNPTTVKRMILDLDLLKTTKYINDHGKAVEASLKAMLAHELVHLLLTGYYDDGVGGDPEEFFNGDETDYKGKTVKKSNEIYKELGIPERNAYTSRDNFGEVLERNKEYTNGNKIDRSIVGDNYAELMDLRHLGNSDDLLIGGKKNNTIYGGGGNDYLYGNDGDDHLHGGGGINHLYGGKDYDSYYIGEGYDIIKDSDGRGCVKLLIEKNI